MSVYIYMCVCVCVCVFIYRVSQEECARLRESVPYVKVYRYNPKHLYRKLNGYGDNSQRSVGFIQVDVLYAVCDVILVQCACPTTRHCNAATLACALQRTVALMSQDNRSAAACVKYLEV